MFFGESDIPAMIAALGGLPIIVGGVETLGLVDEPQEELLEEGESKIVGGGKFVQVQTGTLPALAVNAVITVDGVAHVVHRYQRIDDGALTRVICVKA